MTNLRHCEVGGLHEDIRGTPFFCRCFLVYGYEIDLDLIELVAALAPKDFRDFGFADIENVEVVAEWSYLVTSTQVLRL